jgi:hypothetical protein
MRDSSVYQGILEEGRGEGLIQGELSALRRILRRQGEERFGATAGRRVCPQQCRRSCAAGAYDSSRPVRSELG